MIPFVVSREAPGRSIPAGAEARGWFWLVASRTRTARRCEIIAAALPDPPHRDGQNCHGFSCSRPERRTRWVEERIAGRSQLAEKPNAHSTGPEAISAPGTGGVLIE
jgi:hypothetical protein